MDRISSKFDLLKEKIKSVSSRIIELSKENQKLRENNEELLSKIAVAEEEIKMARKFVRERDIIKSRIKNIVDTIEGAKI
jgi:peptidoglycan hydrolase CwlO-like protein